MIVEYGNLLEVVRFVNYHRVFFFVISQIVYSVLGDHAPVLYEGFLDTSRKLQFRRNDIKPKSCSIPYMSNVLESKAYILSLCGIRLAQEPSSTLSGQSKAPERVSKISIQRPWENSSSPWKLMCYQALGKTFSTLDAPDGGFSPQVCRMIKYGETDRKLDFSTAA